MEHKSKHKVAKYHDDNEANKLLLKHLDKINSMLSKNVSQLHKFNEHFNSNPQILLYIKDLIHIMEVNKNILLEMHNLLSLTNINE